MYQRKLKNFLIYPKFQLTLLFANIIVSAITLMIIHFSVNDVFNKLKNMGEKNNLSADHPYFSFIKHSKDLMSIRLNWAFAVSIFLTTIISIFISHKMAGPIYKLRKFLNEINEDKNPEPLSFRTGDYYQDLPAIVNKAVTKSRESK